MQPRLKLHVFAAAILGLGLSPTVDAQEAIFQKTIQPIFQKHCVQCHGAKQPKAELDLTSLAGLLQGGESGAAVVAGKPDESHLLELVRAGEMPPGKKSKLSEAEIQTLANWIKSHAKPASQALASQPTADDVVPILLLRCVACHGAQKQEAGLDLRSVESLKKGGKSGPAIVAGKPAESLLIKKIKSEAMPPRRRLVEASLKVIEAHEVRKLEQWIAAGAPSTKASDRSAAVSTEPSQFWAFQPPRAALPPSVKTPQRLRNPIDAFVLARLEAKGLSLSPPAKPQVLMRRVFFDLTGLPPTPTEIHAFERAAKTNFDVAYRDLVDRLLASPRYGERWGRYWLDIAGYSDSEGVQHADTVRANAWRYRDYVIRSFNQDKPYDRFLVEQIAGDELTDYRNAKEITPEIYDNLVATGFLRMAPDGTWANITNFVPDRLDVISDEIEILSSSVMGLTFKCAKCHSHKFDPITQRDYYSLVSIFKGAFDEHNWLKPLSTSQFSSGPFGTRWLPFVTSSEKSQWDANENRIKSGVEKLKAELAKQKPSLSEEAFKKLEASTNGKIKQLEGQRKPQPMIRALWDRGDPSPTYLLRRGNYLTPGPRVRPEVPTFLTSAGRLEIKRPASGTTGRRLAFARWLTQPQNPLTSRVMVNRIWKHHFGRGIVATLDNFGKTGAPPTHPKLLDWLATRFVREGWSIKQLHRLILQSATYRQQSAVTEQHQTLDPENQLWSRMPMLRLDAESLRDTLLSISGRLDLRPYGPGDGVKMRDDGLVTSAESAAGWRRSVYVLQRRTQVPTILANFDLPQMGPNCVERAQSTVAPQALHLMNNAMIHKLSKAFAARISQAHTTRAEQIQAIYLHTLSRQPTKEELDLAEQALIRLESVWDGKLEGKSGDPQLNALGNLCHAMMNSAALLYID